MRFLYFFDEFIKPHMMAGKRYCNPTNTAVIDEGLSCIRENDVNIYFYTKNNTTVAFDSGHLNYKGLEGEFAKIKIAPQNIKHVFLTHADVDHAGGIDVKGKNIFPNARIYIGKNEEKYLTGKMHRIIKLGIKIHNCVQLKEEYNLIEDGEVLYFDQIKIQAIYTPGHTLGHMCYLVDDKILMSGDCLAINRYGGYSFFDFFTQYPDMNKESLCRLKDYVADKNLLWVCTGHSGAVRNTVNLFSHIDESATFSRKKPFDENGPFDYTKE